MESFLKGRKATNRVKMPELDREKVLEALSHKDAAKRNSAHGEDPSKPKPVAEVVRTTTDLPPPPDAVQAPRVRLVSENGQLCEILIDLEDGRHLVFELDYAQPDTAKH